MSNDKVIATWAGAFLSRMLERELITLVNANSALAVRQSLTELFLDDLCEAPVVAELLLDHPDVVDLHCDDEALAAVLAETEPQGGDAGEPEVGSSEPEPVQAKPSAPPAFGTGLVAHPRADSDARVVRVFGAERPKTTRAVADKPVLAEERRYIPAPPLYFVVDLVTPRIARSKLFGVFTQSWFKEAGFPELFGHDVRRDETLFAGTPASQAYFASRGIKKDPVYDRVSFAVPALHERRPRTVDALDALAERIAAAAPEWKPTPRVGAKQTAADALTLAELVEDFSAELSVVLRAPEEGFLGRSVWNVLHESGFRWGDMDLFNWETDQKWSDPSLVWVATSAEPGYFIPEEIAGGRRYPDLEFVMGVGTKPEPAKLAKALLAFAAEAQARLGGALEDVSGAPLDAAGWFAEVIRVHRELEAHGYPAGAPETVELLVSLAR